MSKEDLQADIRNKLSPISTLIEFIEEQKMYSYLQGETRDLFVRCLERSKNNVSFLSNHPVLKKEEPNEIHNTCPECLQPTSAAELKIFGGLCEECMNPL